MDSIEPEICGSYNNELDKYYHSLMLLLHDAAFIQDYVI